MKYGNNLGSLLIAGYKSIDSQDGPELPKEESPYIKNCNLTDGYIKSAYERIEALFPDKKTAYVTLSDHGLDETGILFNGCYLHYFELAIFECDQLLCCVI